MATYLIGTANQGKIREISALVQDLPHTFVFLSDLAVDLPEVEENGATYKENALIKARAYAQISKLPTLSEDAGLEVHELNNFPGVLSNRWAVGSDVGRNQGVLDKLRDSPDRSAHFSATVVLYDPTAHETHTFVGILEGSIADAPRGKDGFGYDPILIPSGQDKTMAELGVKWKTANSHRTMAWKLAANYLADQVS